MYTKLLSSFQEKSFYNPLFNEVYENSDSIIRIVMASYNSNLYAIENFIGKLDKSFKWELCILLWSADYNSYYEIHRDDPNFENKPEKIRAYLKSIQNLYTIIPEECKITISFSLKSHAKLFYIEYPHNSSLLISSQNISCGENIEVWTLINDSSESKKFIDAFIGNFQKESIDFFNLVSVNFYQNTLSEISKALQVSLNEQKILLRHGSMLYIENTWMSFEDFQKMSFELNKFKGTLIHLQETLVKQSKIWEDYKNKDSQLISEYIESNLVNTQYSYVNGFLEMLEEIDVLLDNDIPSILDEIYENIEELIEEISQMNLETTFTNFTDNFNDRIVNKIEEWSFSREQAAFLTRVFYSQEEDEDPASVYHEYFLEEDIEELISSTNEFLEESPLIANIEKLTNLNRLFWIKLNNIYGALCFTPLWEESSEFLLFQEDKKPYTN